MITLTAEMIEALMTPKGGYNAATLNALGVGWPPVAGWKQRLIGKSISDKNYQAARTASFKVRHFYRGNTRSHRR